MHANGHPLLDQNRCHYELVKIGYPDHPVSCIILVLLFVLPLHPVSLYALSSLCCAMLRYLCLLLAVVALNLVLHLPTLPARGQMTCPLNVSLGER